jgi:AraC-like DNA-binding protein
MAEEVGMSRSKFAERFRALVGEPPLAYLTRWRMHSAARLLADESLTVGEVARRVGYESETAFSKAFRRVFDTAPGTYRRGAR